MYDIRAYGAAGVAGELCTAAIQRAIDECAANGGGTVNFPAGTYLTGTVYLRDNVTLNLESGARLLGSSRREDYNADDFCPQNRVFVKERVTGAHLIVAVEANNIGITGQGVIDGNRQAFSDKTWEERPQLFEYPEWRPGQMIFFCECTNVTITDVKLYNSPYWTCFLHGCEDVVIAGVRIWNDQRTWNGDGIDIDCCARVTVTNCIIDSGDDCITLRGHIEPLKDQSRVCQHVTVSNCILRTRCNAFRIGVGSGEVRDCVISNCVIWDTRTAVCIISKYSEKSLGVKIENILFNNLHIEAMRPIIVSSNVRGCQPDETVKLIRNISFNHLRGRARWSSFVTGNPDCLVKDISFSDVWFEYSGGADAVPPEKAERSYGEFGVKCAPVAFYLLNADGVEFDRCRVSWRDPEPGWQAAIMAQNVSGLRLERCRLEAPPGGVECIQNGK
ncbi:MAG: hypothetical protein GX574_05605 [Lentisphaerae bacterium]|nr:hypothetical protein [Lentisphaerota bacterium]OQC17190.1 MAG: Exo-poly-alpha-D-galacturonosidase precursor [Lentisphaerae bacterium ADurb.Bin082]